MTNLQPPSGASPSNQPQQPQTQAQPPQPGWVQQPPPAPPARAHRKPRVFMWVILAINALFAWWLIAAVGAAGGANCAEQLSSNVEACQTGEAIGTGIAAFMIIGIWAFVDVILGVIYLVTRRR